MMLHILSYSEAHARAYMQRQGGQILAHELVIRVLYNDDFKFKFRKSRGYARSSFDLIRLALCVDTRMRSTRVVRVVSYLPST